MASAELQQIVALLRSQPLADKLDVQATRQSLEAMANVFPVAADVSVEPIEVSGIPAERLTPPSTDTDRIVLYLHGGGYICGSVRTHRELASRVARASCAPALLLDYRLAPEHPFPAAIHDAVAAYRWLLAQGFRSERIAMVGDSAGGGLTVATLLALKTEKVPLPAAAVCMSPWLDLEGAGASVDARASRDPMLRKESLIWSAHQYLGDIDPRHPLASPIYADLSGMPPLLLLVGTDEILYDDAIRLHDRARKAGVDSSLDVGQEMIHGWPAFPILPEAKQAVDRIGAFIRERTGAPSR